jgi:hypothetical protein
MKRPIWTAIKCFLVYACAAAALAEEIGANVEDIYVVRSLRVSRVEVTSFCEFARTGFPKMDREDQYNFQSISVNTADGKVTDANVTTVGTLHACFGPMSDPKRVAFYGEGSLGGTSFTGSGECLIASLDFHGTSLA